MIYSTSHDAENKQKLVDRYSYVFIKVVFVDVLDRQAEHLGWELAHPSGQRGALLELRVRLWLFFVSFLFRHRAALLFAPLRQLLCRLLFLSEQRQWPSCIYRGIRTFPWTFPETFLGYFPRNNGNIRGIVQEEFLIQQAHTVTEEHQTKHSRQSVKAIEYKSLDLQCTPTKHSKRVA